jgi:glutamyl-tRNA reductase
VREKLYLHDWELRPLLREAKKTLSECVILSTCNRTEFYGVSDSSDLDPHFYKDLLIDFKNARGVVRDEHFFTLISCAACRQLFNVATSIDSKIVGDSQILRQLRGAYSVARETESAGKVLNQLLQRAFKIGKKTFTETVIHQGAVSVSVAAVELALETFGSLQGRSVLIVGGGETARLTAEALINKRVGKVLISNRTRSSAEELLTSLHKNFEFESDVIDFEDFTRHLEGVDIVISATSSERPIIYKQDLAHRQSKILLIDIAVPRDIDGAVVENPYVTLTNIDDLHSIVDDNHERRMNDLPKIKKLVMSEMVDFLTWYYSLPLMPRYGKTGVKPAPSQTAEILRIKNFLGEHVSEIHKLAASSGGDFRDDLQNHFSLIHKLKAMKADSRAVDV